MKIVSRAQWGARTPLTRYRMALPSPRLWIHHTAGEEHGAEGVRSIQRFHMNGRGWSDIAYSFLVDDDGTIYEGRGVGVVGAHTKDDNSSSHAICAMGNFDVREPTDEMVAAIGELAAAGKERGWWGEVTGGHRDAPGASTACPGRHLYARLDDIRNYQEDDMTREELDDALVEADTRAKAREEEMLVDIFDYLDALRAELGADAHKVGDRLDPSVKALVTKAQKRKA